MGLSEKIPQFDIPFEEEKEKIPRDSQGRTREEFFREFKDAEPFALVSPDDLYLTGKGEWVIRKKID
ncbi:MAG: hypothetical protein V2A55_01340 [Candidatus Jorgensenbacteria bacterium]